jgi:hypothetical protein
MFEAVLRAIDKEFSLPANYPKGHGDMFLHWLKRNHPGALLVPVERTAGSRQDLAAEGAAAMFTGIVGEICHCIKNECVNTNLSTLFLCAGIT